MFLNSTSWSPRHAAAGLKLLLPFFRTSVSKKQESANRHSADPGVAMCTVQPSSIDSAHRRVAVGLFAVQQCSKRERLQSGGSEEFKPAWELAPVRVPQRGPKWDLPNFDSRRIFAGTLQVGRPLAAQGNTNAKGTTQV